MGSKMSNNYPPGFTQTDHDRQYSCEPICIRCERTLNECEDNICTECQENIILNKLSTDLRRLFGPFLGCCTTSEQDAEDVFRKVGI